MGDVDNPWLSDRTAVAVLLVLTFVAGGVDATTFLYMGGTFVSNQTGTVILLGVNVAGPDALDSGAAVMSIVGFFIGASLAGRVMPKLPQGQRWPRHSATLLWIEAALLLTSGLLLHFTSLSHLFTVAPLGLAMGAQAALAFRMAKPFLTTGYITGALTSAAASSPAGDTSRPWWWYAALPIGCIGLGAVTMTWLGGHSPGLAIGFMTALAAICAMVATRDVGVVS